MLLAALRLRQCACTHNHSQFYLPYYTFPHVRFFAWVVFCVRSNGFLQTFAHPAVWTRYTHSPTYPHNYTTSLSLSLSLALSPVCLYATVNRLVMFVSSSEHAIHTFLRCSNRVSHGGRAAIMHQCSYGISHGEWHHHALHMCACKELSTG